MKKLTPIIIVIVLIAAVVVAFLASKKDNGDVSTSKSTVGQQVKSTPKNTIQKACDVLTLSDAQKVLGSTAKAGDSNTDAPTVSDDLVVSTCTYSDVSDSPGQSKTASVLVRAAKTSKGASSNKAQFSSQKPAGAQDVSGYGEAAFWNPSFGQLNILKDGTWYIISNGPLKVSERTVDQGKQLADIINSKL